MFISSRNIKPVVKKEEEEVKVDVKREMSPELAKISALVTGQPKSKSVAPPIPPISKITVCLCLCTFLFLYNKSLFMPF